MTCDVPFTLHVMQSALYDVSDVAPLSSGLPQRDQITNVAGLLMRHVLVGAWSNAWRALEELGVADAVRKGHIAQKK